VDRVRAVPADYPLGRTQTWRKCSQPRPAGIADLTCVPMAYTNRQAVLRKPAWSSRRSGHLLRTHDGLEVGYKGRVGFKALFDAALYEAGHELFVTSGYRPYAVQAAIFEDHVRREMATGLERSAAVAAAATYSARPGHSEHQLGTTADLTYRTDEGINSGFGGFMAHLMRQSPAMTWVRANAHRFGVALTYRHDRVAETQYAWEPWHWRFVGEEAADIMAACDLSVAEFVEHIHNAKPPPPFVHATRIARDDASVAPAVHRVVAEPGGRVELQWWVTNMGARQWTGYDLRPLFMDSALADVPIGRGGAICVPPLEAMLVDRILRAPARPGVYRARWSIDTGAGPVDEVGVELIVASKALGD